MKLQDKIDEFRDRQVKMIELAKECNTQVEACREESQSRADAIQSEFETKRAQFLAPLDQARSVYNADIKAAFGLSDGERSNVLDLVQLVATVSG